MSLDLEQRLRVFFASAPQTIRHVITLEVGHPAMSKAYYFWREPVAGEITTEDGVRTVQPMAFQEKAAGSPEHLDQVFEITLDTTDITDDFHAEMDRVPIDSPERVRIVLREYLSDDLTDVQARAVLQVESVSYTMGAATLKAVSPRLNVTSTGERYVTREVPMLRAFL